MGEAVVRFYSGTEAKTYLPRIRDAVARNRFPFTGCQIIVRANTASAPALKDSVAQMLTVVAEIEKLGIACHAGVRLYPPTDWTDNKEWLARADTIKSIPDFLRGPCSALCPCTRMLWIDLELYGGGRIDLEAFKVHASILPIFASKFQAVATYPCITVYTPFGKALGAQFMADEPFDLCRMVAGIVPTPADMTRNRMIAFLNRNRLAVEAAGATYIPGVIDSLFRPKHGKALIEWQKINLAAGVPGDATWFVYVDEKQNFLSDDWFEN